MEKKIIIIALLIALLSVVFSMSGDGGNVPVQVTKELKHETSHETKNQPSQNEENFEKVELSETENVIKYSDPVRIEECGLRVHMNPKGIYASEKFKSPDQPEGEVLEKLYQKYKNKYFGLGLKAKGIVSVLFYNKINLNAIEEFKTIGVDLYELDKRKFGDMNDKANIIFAKICITGTVIDSISVPDPKSSYHTLYKIKVDKMYKGSEYYSKIPDIINIYTTAGKVLIGGTKEMDMQPMFRHINRIGESVNLGLVQSFISKMKLDSISFNVYMYMENEDFVKKFEEINNSKNFFKEVLK